MAVKGKEIAGKGKSPSTSKRKSVSKPDDSANARASKRNRSNALKFFDDEAVDAGISEEDQDDSENELDQDFIDDEPETKGANKIGRLHHLPFLLKEEELSDDELEKLLKERYCRGSNNVVYADENQDTKDYNDRVHSMNSAKDPTIWRVKCMVGRERQIAFCLMQKFVDLQSFGTKLHMISAFALDHMKGHIYIEADRECDVTEACKGLCSVYSSRLVLVPKNEVPHLLAPRNKLNDVSKGSWVRIKCGKYKGDLAQVVAVDDAQKKATIKMIPRIDLQAISLKLGGGGETVDEVSVPAPRLISSHELEDFRPHIQYKRDRQTGEIFEIFDGLMLKNGYLYKKVSIASLSCWEIKPSAAEIQKFMCADGTSEDSEWLSVLYGGQKKSHSGIVDNVMSGASESTSETKEGDNYELTDLVLFGRKEFGVIVGVGKDDFQILNGDLERPNTVTVKLRELKNRISDKNFTARDSQKKIISINDSVRILKGPFKAQQGIVKHIYKGTIFIFDYKQLENSGFFCAKPEFCKKIMYPKDACDGIADDEMAPPGFEKSSGSPAGSPKRPYQRSDSNQAFNSNSHAEREQTFSIGQTLRIRVGPLKGHLCRVVAIYRSDVTVKLDSQSKVLKVNCEHLSEVGVKSFGNVLRDSLHDLSASGFTGKPSDADPFGAFSNYNDHETGKDETADPWGTGNKVADSWGKGTPSTGGQNVSWTKATDGSNGDKLSSEQIAHGWDRAIVKTDIGSSSSDGWNKPNVHPGDQAGSWEVASEWGKDKLGSETQADHPTNGMSGWEKRNASTDQADPWKKLEKTLEDGNNGSVSQKDAWNSQNVNLRGTEESNQDKGKGVVDDNQSSWNKGKGGSENVTTSWGKAVELQSNKISQANQLDVWGKASGTGNEGSGKNKADSWNNTTAADGIQTGGWADVTGQKDKPEVGWGNQAGGWSKAEGESGGWSESQDKSKYGNAGGWNKGSVGHGQPDSWSKPQPSGGDRASNWTKGGRSENWDKSKDVSEGKTVGWTEAGFASGSQTDSWNKPKSFGGDQSSNWNKGKAVNDDPGGREKDQGKIWNRSGDADGGWKSDWNKGMTGNTEIGGERNHEDSWNQPKTFDGGWRGGRRGGRGGTGGRGGGNRNHEDSWSHPKAFDGGQGAGWRGGRGGAGGRGFGGRPFGRGRSSDQSRDQGSHWDRDGESPAWNSDQAGGWNQGAATSGEANWKNVGKDTSGNTDRWNSEDARGGDKSFGWTKETNAGGNREWSDKLDQAKSFGGDKSSGWNKRESENKDAPNWNGGSSFIGDQSSSWKKDVTSDKGNDGKGQLSAWSKGAVSDKGNDGNGGWANSWNTPKSFGQGQSSGWGKGDGDNGQSDSWKRTQGFGQGQSSHWQKEAGTDIDDGSRDQVDSWNKSKPFGRGESFGRGQSSGRNGGAFGRGRGRRDQAGSWNKRNDFANDGGGGTSEVDSWSQGDSSSKGQWSTWNKGTDPSKEKWGSNNQGGSGWSKETPPTNEGGVAGDRTNNWNSANASGGGQSSGWGKEEHVSSWNQAKTVERSFGGDGSSGWKKDPTANKGGGVSGQAESWSKGSSWNAGNSSKHAEAVGGVNQAGWNQVKVSDGTGSSNWNSTTSIKNTGGTDDAQPSGFTRGPVQGEGGSGTQAGVWGKTGKSWGEGSHRGGDSHGWK